MPHTNNVMYWIMILVSFGSIHASAEPFAKGPYLGQTPPGSTAQVFAPGLISDTQPQTWESNGTFSADGNTFCYLRGSVHRSGRVGGVFIIEKTSQGWTAPKLIESIQSNQHSTWAPYLAPDANSIYFTRALLKQASTANLYRCDRTAFVWGDPQVLGPPLSSPAAEWACSIAADNSFYIASTRKGGHGSGDVWHVPFIDNTWSQAINLAGINTRHSDGAPGVAPDESFLVFNSVRPGGVGGADLYLSLRQPDGTWTAPRNLGPRVNSAYLDICPHISPDKKYMFFTRSNGFDPRKNSADIYWVALKEYLPDPNDPNINQTDLGIGTNGLHEEFFAKGPYLGQTPPGPVAKVFAPGLICDTRPHHHEIHGHFSADGNTFCYRRHGYVYITENTDQGWTTPERIKSIPYKTWSCCLSPDANTIYFLDQLSPRSNRTTDEPAKHIYKYCTRGSQGWSMSQQLGLPFTRAFGGFSVTADHSICFKSEGACFEIAPFVGNTWAQPIKIPVEKGKLNPCDPAIAPDGSFLVFYSIRPGAEGGTPTDLYLMLRRADGTWTKPHRMGPGINTEYYEIGARISPDKKYLFFTRSNGWNINSATNTADIYWVELKEHLPESHR